VQEHPALVSKVGEGFYFGRLVHSPYFSGLRDGNNAGLYVVGVINAMVGMTDGVDRKLAVGYGDGKKLAASKFLRSPAFVGVDVCSFAADHCVICVSQRFQAEAIGCSAIEDEKDFNIRAETLLEFLRYRGRVRIISVADRVAPIRFANGFQNFRMNSGIVVAGKTAGRFHIRNNVADTCYGTMVVLLREYDGDLGEAATRNYVGRMTLVLMMVVLAFGLLYVAVVAEERQMQEATKPRKR